MYLLAVLAVIGLKISFLSTLRNLFGIFPKSIQSRFAPITMPNKGSFSATGQKMSRKPLIIRLKN